LSNELFKHEAIVKLLKKYSVLWALEHARNLMYWDMRTYMPREGVVARGKALAELTLLSQKIFLSKEFKELFEVAMRVKDELNDFEKGVLRVLRREMEYFEKLPPEFLEEWEKTTTVASKEWEKAKAKSDYSIFQPYLEKIFELAKKMAELLGYEEHPYDALLDLFEEGMRKKDVDAIFFILKDKTIDILKRLEERGYPKTSPLEKEKYEIEAMKKLNLEVLKIIGYDFSKGRLDVSAHPFTISMSVYDVRITTRYSGANFKESLYAVLHEFGHALYELQIDPRLEGTPIGTGVSLGIHESQSRFWENIIGRSSSFLKVLRPLLEKYLPFIKKYSFEDLYYYVNLVRPSLIRVYADEVTYNLHILVRYEIEVGVLDEKFSLDELPKVWNDKMEEYLGIRPKSDSKGILQDVHWSSGYIGYFPTYTVGNIVAAQIRNKIQDELEGIEGVIESRNFGRIKSWLAERIHKWGATYPPKELLRREIGEELNAKYLVSYLEDKYLNVDKHL